jgi:hypothetical protein
MLHTKINIVNMQVNLSANLDLTLGPLCIFM